MDLLRRLPEDLVVNHIFHNLDLTTRIRAGAVCRTWRRAVFMSSSPPPADIPWLCLTVDDCKSHNHDPMFLVNTYIPAAHRSPSTTAVDKIGTAFTAIGSQGQYLIGKTFIPGPSNRRYPPTSPGFAFSLTPLLYHPFTGETIHLPSTARFPGSRAPMPCKFHLARLSSCPPTSDNASWDDAMVAALFGDDVDGHQRLCVCRVRGYDWVKGPYLQQIHDLIFHKGELYCIDHQRRVVAFDPQQLLNYNTSDTAAPRMVVSDQEPPHAESSSYINKDLYSQRYYLVESARGDQLMVVTLYDSPYMRDLITSSVHMIEQERGRLVQVEDLGDQMLFVSKGSSRSRTGSVQTQCGFFSTNCVYFISHSRGCSYLGKFCLGKGQLGSSFAVFHSLPTPLISNSCVWVSPPSPPTKPKLNESIWRLCCDRRSSKKDILHTSWYEKATYTMLCILLLFFFSEFIVVMLKSFEP